MGELFECLKYELICDTCGNKHNLAMTIEKMKELDNQPCKRPWCTGHYKFVHLEDYGYDYHSKEPNHRNNIITRVIREDFFPLPTFDREAYRAECLLYEQENAKKQPSSSTPKCPICGSTVYVQKISTANRTISVLTLGLASSKIGKQYHCKSCGHKW